MNLASANLIQGAYWKIFVFTANLLALSRGLQPTIEDDMNVPDLNSTIVFGLLRHDLFSTRNVGNNRSFAKLLSTNSTDLSEAIRAMEYHRHMMNEYMLSEYLAKRIAASLSYTHSENLLEKRIGVRKNNSMPYDAIDIKPSLSDEGSSRYLTWLRSETPKILDNRQKFSPQRRFSADAQYDDNDLRLLEDGDITGYAYAPDDNPHQFSTDLRPNYRSEGKVANLNFMSGISKTGYDNGYGDYLPNIQHTQVHTPTAVHPTTSMVTNQLKEIGLKDITDIALTTLAFLSFGMFILQVLMCIVMNKDDTTTMAMLPMEDINGGDIPDDGTIEEIRRKRRSVTTQYAPKMDSVNKLAHLALFSIDSVTSAHIYGSCHYYSLCESNRIAKLHDSGQQFWIPTWSLGISWLTSRLNGTASHPFRGYYKALQSLKSLFIGLSSGDCSAYYDNEVTNNECVKG